MDGRVKPGQDGEVSSISKSHLRQPATNRYRYKSQNDALSREAHFGGVASLKGLDTLPHKPGAPSPKIGGRTGPQNTFGKIGSLTRRLAARTTCGPSSPPLESVIVDA